jgi:hypothetical protein
MSNIYDKASLVLIPSGTKTSKVYSQKPTNGDGDFTFSRSTAATRVNASGNIEKETSNLLVQSNTFDTTWVNVNTTETGGQSDKDGGSTAWLLSKSAASARIEQSVSQSGVQTFSLFAKAGSLNWVRLNVHTAWAYYDLANGVVGSDINNIVDHNIYDVGGGWYRCELVVNLTATIARIYPAQNDGDVSGTSGNIVIQDAQLEQGLVARNYIETTTTAIYGGITDNVPRLDYTDSSCPALLLEPQRTNLLAHSEHIEGYLKERVIITANSITSPEGVQNAAKINADSSPNNTHNAYLGPYTNTAGNVTYSGFFKKGEYNWVHFGGGAASSKTWFNLNTGVVGSQSSDVVTASMIDFGNGWYRCIAVVNYASTSNYVEFGPASVDNSRVISGTPIGGIYCWGIQFEDSASYATSYIPTYGSAVTRNEDVFKVSDVGTNNLITNDAFTLFVDIASVQDSVNSFRDLVAIFGSKNFRIETRTNGQVRAQQIGMVTSGDDFNSVTIGTYSNTKFAFTFTTSQCKIYVDGALHSTYNGVYTHDFNVLSVRNSSSLGAELKNEYRKVMLFPTAITDQEAIDLTTI